MDMAFKTQGTEFQSFEVITNIKSCDALKKKGKEKHKKKANVSGIFCKELLSIFNHDVPEAAQL